MWKHYYITSNNVSMKIAHANRVRAYLDDVVFKNYSITNEWFYKSKRHTILV